MKKFFRSQYGRVCFDLIKVKTSVTLQVVTCLEKAGLILKCSLKVCISKVILQTGFIILEKTERVELTEL